VLLAGQLYVGLVELLVVGVQNSMVYFFVVPSIVPPEDAEVARYGAPPYEMKMKLLPPLARAF